MSSGIGTIVQRIDTRAKIGAAACLTISSAAAPHAAGLALLAICMAVLYTAARISLHSIYRHLRPIFWLGALTILLGSGSGGRPLMQVGNWQYTTADALAGGLTAARLLLLVTAAAWISLTTTPTELVRGLRHVLEPMRRVRLPIDALTMAVWIALRFLPVLEEEAFRIRRAQTARAIDCDRSLLGMGRRLTSLVVPLLAAVLRRADTMTDALVVRGFQPGQVWWQATEQLHKRDWVFLCSALAIGIAAVWV